MNIVASQIGIDVSKGWLDVGADGQRPFRILNTRAECESLALRLPPGCTVHLESSGGYERTAVRVLEEAGIDVRVHDPLRVRRISLARSGRAKTDPLDAMSLAMNASLLREPPRRTLEQAGLADHSRAADELKAAASQFQVRAKAAELDPAAKAAYLEAAATLQKQAQDLERQFERRVKASSFQRRYELALTVPGVGKRLARVCVAELPEDLDQFTAPQICSYAGLAPIDSSSGLRKGRSRLGHGNSRLKGAHYMPGISAMRSQPWARELYARLKTRGRSHQQAIVAVMRRLLVRVVAVLKRGSPWQDQPPRT